MPFTLDHRRAALAASPADVSSLLDAPAGKHGFVRVKDGHLATEGGQRIRFWGVNITDWSPGSRQIPSKEDAAFWAATLARFGVNCVRFQFLDLKEPRGLIDNQRPDTRALDPEQVDREDLFIAELEKRGIYVDFNLLVGRPFQSADDVQDAGMLREGAKGTSIFDRRMIELQKEYAQQLLDHLNPYTKRKYTDDPAVALIEINNENALNVGYRAPSPFYLIELTGMYNDWLARHRTPDEISQLRRIAGIESDKPVTLIATKGKAAASPPERFHAEAEFYNDVQRNYFDEMEKYLKEDLRSKSLVIATADHSHANSGYPILLAASSADLIDGHDYWEHPESYVRKSPMVNDPLHSTVVDLSRSAIAGKPYTVSEVNNPFPNDYDSEGIPILAAYGLLQDWDGIMWYTFEPKADAAWKPYVGDPFDISSDPVKMPELAAGALLFLRGDVAKAHTTVERSYSREQAFDSMLLPEATERPFFTPGFPLTLPLQHEVRVSSLQGGPTKAFDAAAVTDAIVSDTGQLAWYTSHPQEGLVTIDTPRTQALIGFARAYNKQLSNLAAVPENSFCTIQLSSLDGRAIGESSRMLLVAGGTVRNSGERWNTAGTDVTEWGGFPTLIEPVTGTITLRQIQGAKAISLQALDGAGQPVGEKISAAFANGGWSLSLGDTVTSWYEVTVSR
ncbi:hypothetical protein HNQ77_001119 [Silvibacterium bohemicum]|uniref:Glycoside hydrolase family 5 domain-containing protein n=1 Tax=Silvibacterium bohemicum TaxID=1577686 RepID=A0A841JRZ0_9BACT|nr:hypothetical protein [Silvibacterium bohemicum]MBB6143175.1 hypothetical protein [Silvibacterium bohemicum]